MDFRELVEDQKKIYEVESLHKISEFCIEACIPKDKGFVQCMSMLSYPNALAINRLINEIITLKARITELEKNP